MVSPDSRLGTVGIYIQYITKIVVLVSEPVRGRSRATELPCFFLNVYSDVEALVDLSRLFQALMAAGITDLRYFSVLVLTGIIMLFALVS